MKIKSIQHQFIEQQHKMTEDENRLDKENDSGLQ